MIVNTYIQNLQMHIKKPHAIVCEDDLELNMIIRCVFKLDGFESYQATSSKRMYKENQ